MSKTATKSRLHARRRTRRLPEDITTDGRQKSIRFSPRELEALDVLSDARGGASASSIIRQLVMQEYTRYLRTDARK